MSEATFDFSGDYETYDVSDYHTVVVRLSGAGGEDGEDSEYIGGVGGLVEGEIDVTFLDLLHIYVGGGNGNQWGYYNGGSGSSSGLGSAGAGGGETSIRDTDGNEIVAAHAGGGGTFRGSFDRHGGGGGAAGGSGGFGNEGDGDDAEGSGPGGDGGSTDGNDIGGDGGVTYDDSLFGVGTESTGGGNTGNGQIEILEVRSAPDVPENLTAVSVDESTVDLEWDQASGAATYYVYRARSSSSDLADYDEIASVTDPSHTDTGLINGREYHYRVTSDTNGFESDPSENASSITDLPTPTLESASGGDRKASLQFARNDDNPDGDLHVVRDGGTVVTLDPDATTYSDDGANFDGESYEYTIERDTGEALAESTAETTITNLPSLEGFDVVDIDGRHVTLEATDPSNNAAGYRLLLREDDDGGYSQDGSDYDPVAEEETVAFETTELLDGQLYGATVETYTDHATAREDQ